MFRFADELTMKYRSNIVNKSVEINNKAIVYKKYFYVSFLYFFLDKLNIILYIITNIC